MSKSETYEECIFTALHSLILTLRSPDKTVWYNYNIQYINVLQTWKHELIVQTKQRIYTENN